MIRMKGFLVPSIMYDTIYDSNYFTLLFVFTSKVFRSEKKRFINNQYII